MSSISDVVFASQKLQQLISKALTRIGVEDEGDEQAKEITKKLDELYIRTPDQLKTAIDDPGILPDVRLGAIRGMLLPAVRTEFKREEAISSWRRAVSKVAKQKKELNKPLLRRLQVARADFTQLSAIDQVSQTFRARLLLILRITDGALDSNLTKDFEGFPFDEDGRPTFRPSAQWYLNQVDFPNGGNIQVIESKVTTEKNDLQLIKRVEGEFFERFELQNFPFDAQDLTITVSVNCANEGPVPVEFVDETRSSDGLVPQMGVDTLNFAFDDIWNLSPFVSPEITTVGATAKRRFPAVHLRACVSRKPYFILLNVAVPITCIAFLSLMTFFVPAEDTGDRLELSITILLTAVAFKYASAAYLPQISYLTLVDIFVLLCTSIVVLASVCHSVLGLLHNWMGIQRSTLETLNKVFFAMMALAWLAVQVWFICRARVAGESDTDAGQKRAMVTEAAEEGNSPLIERGMEPIEDTQTQDITIKRSKSGRLQAYIGDNAMSFKKSIRRSIRTSMSNIQRSIRSTTNTEPYFVEEEDHSDSV
uniref:Neurotransmitter-gated ion-channel transmembrane domain-containing protein n=1 Tax=Odontella aurita TaxID=265563 RepID=A0A7S4I2D5_9STRA|mmetsp:Transcript_18907/g.54755  ORF Transcript_18907/g.54755 Transcript_18907/m.54755 type:complete len:537 (+) Transcript_18907:211-1821(+)